MLMTSRGPISRHSHSLGLSAQEREGAQFRGQRAAGQMTTSRRLRTADIGSLTVLEAGSPTPVIGKAGVITEGRLPGRKPPASPSVLALGCLTPTSTSLAPSPRGCVLWEHLRGLWPWARQVLLFPLCGPVSGEHGAGLCPPPWSPSTHYTAPSFPGGLAAGGGSSAFQGEVGSTGRAPPSLEPWSLVGPLGDSTSSLLN